MTARPIARIRALPERLANQIAAGEVVERPASVLKELVENSLDAGATRINVDIERGGTRLIRVRDDGIGIHRDDLVLALHRHATSKIATLEDLVRVASLGFRGEALPSIASVSRLELCSSTGGEDGGFKVSGKDTGMQASVEPAPHPQGTTVTVRDLFYNTPARRKFLRTEKTEFRHIEDVVKRAALSRFDCAFTLRHNDRRSLALAAAGTDVERSRRVAKLCGGAFAERALTLDFEAAGLQLGGWIGAPGYTRGVSDLQYFFVNGRMVRDNLLRHAVRHAHDGFVESGRHPAYVLFLGLDPAEVDVNVHPSKHEVRFRDARSVHDFIARSVRVALSGRADSEATAPSPPRAPSARSHAGEVRDHLGAYDAFRARATEPSGGAGASSGEVLHDVDGRFLIARTARGLVVVDVRRALVRVAAERIRSGLDGGALRARPLLVPAAVTMDARRADVLEAHARRLEALGFDLRRVAAETVSCRGIPSPLADAAPEALVAALAEALLAGAGAGETRAAALALLDAVLQRCDLASGRPRDRASMNALIGDLERLEGGERPPSRDRIWRTLDAGDIARWLGSGREGAHAPHGLERESR